MTPETREELARAMASAKGIDPDAIGYGCGREMPEGASYPLWKAWLSAADALAPIIERMVAERVAAETERCAGIIEKLHSESGLRGTSTIAAAIRSATR